MLGTSARSTSQVHSTHREECKKHSTTPAQNPSHYQSNNNNFGGTLNLQISNLKENKDSQKTSGNIERKFLDENQLLELMCKRNQRMNSSNESLELDDYKSRDQSYTFPRLFVSTNCLDPFVLQPSLFHQNNVPPTIYFNTRVCETAKPPVGLPKSLNRLFRWRISSITPNSIRNCITFMKFETIRPTNTTDKAYLGSWCKHMPTSEFGQLEEWRKVNHYPGSFHMGRKDKLWLRLKLANMKHNYSVFHPRTFVLPRDYDELNKFWYNSPSNLFIMKPPASARGNGIKVINNLSQIPDNVLKPPESIDGAPTKRSTMIVQQYISNPCLLENGQKFDLRIYVLLTSVDPLRIYVCEEGLVRFASTKYSSQESGIIDQYMHLTNYFVNKNNQEYQINNDCDSLNGNKWTLRRFWKYLADHCKQVDTKKLWDEIIDIIIKTVICCEGPMTRLSHQNCKNDYTSYELFGFDIILDQEFKPWILEVNITPSLKSESLLDTSVKFRVIRDMFNLVGYHLPPPPVEENIHLNEYADCKLFFDHRLYTENLTKRDKMKHLKYQKLNKMEIELGKYSPHENGSAFGDLNCQPPLKPTLLLQPQDGIESSSSLNQHDYIATGRSSSSCANYGNHQQATASVNEPNLNGETVIESAESILDDLTQSDVRVLMLAEDELSRCGQFKRVFPSATSSTYLRYFDRPRYYNLLLDAWEQRYKDNRLDGIKLLSSLANFLE